MVDRYFGQFDKSRQDWGGMVEHAVTHYGVEALAVVLSRHQALWARKASPIRDWLSGQGCVIWTTGT